jgi:uncharacterized protein YuzE
MMAKFDFDYDDKYDILYIFRKSEKVKFSLDFRDMFIVDFNDDRKVVGLEILDASELIFGMTKARLRGMESADMQVRQRRDVIVAQLTLKSKNSDPIQTSMPIPVFAR